jgi:hypothetical protein
MGLDLTSTAAPTERKIPGASLLDRGKRTPRSQRRAAPSHSDEVTSPWLLPKVAAPTRRATPPLS